MYSQDHLWAKSVSANIVVVGISAILEKILGEPFKISDAVVGSVLAQGDSFVTIEGFKISADLRALSVGQLFKLINF
ncbi:MAG: hypothetical protein C4542_02330 [Dehalococcoidia bacterium]|nr:MAG: hypothetical protein C4542_02330 [Dehalococcoidia bacterium]